MSGGPPRLVLTQGDPGGIGPEVLAKTLLRLEREGGAAALEGLTLAGDPEVFARGGLPPRLLAALPLLVTRSAGGAPPGGPSAASGAAAAEALFAAIDHARSGHAEGVVTAPLSKEALALAGHPWPGQTEILVERSGAARGVMLFAGGGIKVALATRHVALSRVPELLEPRRIADDLVLLHRGLVTDFGLPMPRLAVTGLNPHAGEGGLFGDEEERILAPALRAARERGAPAAGPLPADTAFVRLRRGEFDAVLAMYHDQGLIPVKLLAFGGGVNVTLGLPFVRTSPDHGTAYDIAGKGVADPGSFAEALGLARELVLRRRGAT